MDVIWTHIIKSLLVLLLFSVSCQKTRHNGDEPVSDTLAQSNGDTIVAINLDPAVEDLGIGEPAFGDLDSMIERRRIRVLVPYTHSFYHIDGKERRGIAFDAMSLFEKFVNDRLGYRLSNVRVIFIPVSRDKIIPLLRNGYGDIGFAGLTVMPEREELIDFTIPTITGLREIVVGGPAGDRLADLDDLSGKHVFVHEFSSYHKSLQLLNDTLSMKGLQPVSIEPVDPYLEVEEILEMVHTGAIPYTVIIEPAAQLWAKMLDDLVLYSKMPIMTDVSYAWAIRKNSPQLMEVCNDFLRENRKGSRIGNILYRRYVEKEDYLKDVYAPDILEQYEELERMFRKYATMYRFDWLWLAALGYQESRFDQSEVSHAGAVGIMQLIPATAKAQPISIDNIYHTENNIHAGAKYLRHVADHYFSGDGIDSLNQLLFSLAAYNAGPTRIRLLQQEAQREGLDPNVWFDNVEKIAAREIGRETVQYVSNIYKFFSSFLYLRRYSQKSGKTILP